MENHTRDRILGNPAFKVFRWVMPWVALAVVLYALSGYWVDFKRYRPPVVAASNGSSASTSTTDATSSVAATGSVVVTLAEVRLRTQPVGTSQPVASVGKGVRLTVQEVRKDWLRVKDPLGRVGWVTSAPAFIQRATK